MLRFVPRLRGAKTLLLNLLVATVVFGGPLVWSNHPSALLYGATTHPISPEEAQHVKTKLEKSGLFQAGNHLRILKSEFIPTQSNGIQAIGCFQDVAVLIPRPYFHSCHSRVAEAYASVGAADLNTLPPAILSSTLESLNYNDRFCEARFYALKHGSPLFVESAAEIDLHYENAAFHIQNKTEYKLAKVGLIYSLSAMVVEQATLQVLRPARILPGLPILFGLGMMIREGWGHQRRYLEEQCHHPLKAATLYQNLLTQSVYNAGRRSHAAFPYNMFITKGGNDWYHELFFAPVTIQLQWVYDRLKPFIKANQGQ